MMRREILPRTSACAAGRRALGFLLLAAVAGCTQRAKVAQLTPAATATDLVAGTVAVTGASLDQQFVLRTAVGVTRLYATNAVDSTALVRLSGVEVVASGRSDGAAFRVSRLMALRVDGQPVVDGVLRQQDGTLYIDTAAGAFALGHPPSALWALAGARVWLGGPLDAGPTSYGVIVPVR
jgi:hypothetical protein